MKKQGDSQSFPDGTVIANKKTRTPKVQEPSTALTKRDFGIIAQNFDKEPKEIQDRLIAISSQLQLIKLNLSEEAAVISWIVRKQFPGVQDEDILKLVVYAHTDYTPGTLQVELETVRNITAGMRDEVWNNYWNSLYLYKAFGVVSWEKLMSYAPYVYGVLVKPVIK